MLVECGFVFPERVIDCDLKRTHDLKSLGTHRNMCIQP